MEDLVRNFAEGQVSRRVFIRRMVSAGVTLTGATAVANLIQADPAAASECDGSVTMLADYALSPAKLTLPPLGGNVCWVWEVGAVSHTVTDTTGLGLYDSSPNPNGFDGWDWVRDYKHLYTAAGTWTYHCKDAYHSDDLGMPTAGTVKVPMKLSKSSIRVGARVQVSWAQNPLGADLVFDVQMRRPGGSWQAWKNGVTSTSATYRARSAGTYKLRARVRDKVTGKSCRWSPVASFKAT